MNSARVSAHRVGGRRVHMGSTGASSVSRSTLPSERPTRTETEESSKDRKDEIDAQTSAWSLHLPMTLVLLLSQQLK